MFFIKNPILQTYWPYVENITKFHYPAIMNANKVKPPVLSHDVNNIDPIFFANKVDS